MAVLVAGMRALNTNAPEADKLGVLTAKPGTLTNDFFVNVLDMSTQWSEVKDGQYVGKDRSSGAVKWTASAVDLAFGSNTELRAIAEHYAQYDSEQAFVRDFVSAWAKVMDLDQYGPQSKL